MLCKPVSTGSGSQNLSVSVSISRSSSVLVAAHPMMIWGRTTISEFDLGQVTGFPLCLLQIGVEDTHLATH